MRAFIFPYLLNQNDLSSIEFPKGTPNETMTSPTLAHWSLPMTHECNGARSRAVDSGSQKVQHRFGGFKHKSETISITKMGGPDFSSDLERGASP